MRCATGLLLLSLLAPGLAHAATATLTQVAQPASYKPAGRTLDVVGIAPGMTPTAVRDILFKRFGNATVTQGSLGLEDRGTTVETQNFVTQVAAQKDADEISVLFATPTTGNGVVEVSRQQSYRDETAAPTLQQVRAELIEHYGKPSYDGAAVGTGEVQLLAWSFKGNVQGACPNSSCRAQLSEGLNIGSLPAYARSVKAGNDLTIVATLLAGIADPSRATGIVVVMSDAATKLRTLETAVAQMKTALGKPR